MSDLISRSAVLEMSYCVITPSHDSPIIRSAVDVEDIESLPAIDAVPVRHASWIEDGYREIPCVCSYCGEEAHYTNTFKEQFDYDWDENLVSCGYEEIREYVHSNFCPNCGARMDGEENG